MGQGGPVVVQGARKTARYSAALSGDAGRRSARNSRPSDGRSRTGALRPKASPSSTNVYLAVGGNLTISSAELYQNVGPAEDWYIDGSFSGTFQDNETPPNTVTINGTFSGINIKVN